MGDLVQISGRGGECSTDTTQLLLEILLIAPLIAIHPRTGIYSDSDYISISPGFLDGCLGKHRLTLSVMVILKSGMISIKAHDLRTTHCWSSRVLNG